MAHMHFRCKTYKSGGSAAGTQLLYITRQSAEELTASAQQLRYVQDDREDLVHTDSRNIPAWAEGSPYKFFEAAEKHEGVGWVAFEEWKVSLPQALTHEQNLALTRDVIEAIAGNRLPITYAFHDPKTMDGQQQQPHLHLILSRRQNDAHVRNPEQHFRRWNSTHPERGGAQKDATFTEWRSLWQQRVLVSDVINLHLERNGLEERIDPRSLKAQGIEREPEPKLMPRESQEYREQGVIGETMQAVFDIRAERAATLEREQRGAQEYWQERRIHLGLDGRERLPQQVERVRTQHVLSFQQRVSRQTREERAARMERLTTEEKTLTRTLTQMGEARKQLDYWERAGRPAPEPLVQKIERGFTEELVLPSDYEERSSGRATRVRLWDERKEREERRHEDERG